MLLYKTMGLVILWLHCFMVIQTAKRRFNLEVHNFTCQNASKRFLQNECHFTKLANNHFTFSRSIMFNRDMGREVDVRLLIQVLPKNGKKTLNFVDLKINLCDGLTMALYNPLIKVLMDELRKSSNFPYACPLKGGFLYKMENYTVTDKTVPSYSPYLNFTFSLMAYENDLIIGNDIVTGAVVP